ncbi:MAG: hypothetical protein IT372_14180 [Polyangiaceae bacterium]|nr:hypothetical protein [Polyangiaceae bacterium]
MSNVKGAAVTARVRFVRERFGEGALADLLGALQPDARAAIEERILPQAWVPYDLYIDLNVAIDRLFGAGDLRLCYELGRYSAEVNLPTLYKLFYRLGTPMFVFEKAARVWRLHYDSGVLVPIEEGPKLVRLRVEDFQRPHRAHCLSVLGWAAKSIELSGGTVLRAEEERCRTRGDRACEHSLRWC